MSRFRTFVTPHQHQDSLDTASTPEAFLKRELELEGIAFTVTDHGSMASCRKVYELAKKNNLIPILGCELYVRDDNCDILKRFGIYADENGKMAHYAKYFHLTAHAQDQEAYEAMVRLLSLADDRAEQHGSERKPLFTWENLEELSSYNVTFTSSCLVGMVQRHLLTDHPDRVKIAMAYYDRLRSLVKPGNFYVEVFPHRCSHNWDNAVYVHLEDGTRLRYHPKKKLSTDVGEFDAAHLARAFTRKNNPPRILQAVMNNRRWEDLEPKTIVDVQAVEGFIQNECSPLSPNGDIQWGANKFVMALAQRFGDKILISDDSHFAYPEDKIVQDMKLGGKSGGSWKFYESYHRYSSDEAYRYFKEAFGVSEKVFESWIDNSFEFASKFKNFEFRDRKSLPSKFYPENTLLYLKQLIDKHGRMDWNNPVYVKRLKEEIDLFKNNGVIDLLPYFFMAEEIIDFCNQNGVLTGEGRGSAAGVLISYLLGIVHKDPIKHNLSLERFLTLDRIKSGSLPDIDMDIPERDILTDPINGFLKKRFGDHYAQISTDSMLRLKSAMKDVCRAKRGFVLPEIDELARRIPNPPQGIEDLAFIEGYVSEDGQEVKGLLETNEALQEYVKKYPDDWKIVYKSIGITRGKSRHASAYVIANEPIHNFIPLTTISGVKCTQYTMEWVEKVGGIKVDLLGLNTLKDIAGALEAIRERQIEEIKAELAQIEKELENGRVVGKEEGARETAGSSE